MRHRNVCALAEAPFYSLADHLCIDSGYVNPKLQRNSSISSRLEYLSQLSSSTGRSYASEGTGSQIALHNPYDPPTAQRQQLHDGPGSDPNTSANHFMRRPSDMLRTLADYSPNDRIDGEEGGSGYVDDEYWEDEDEEDENRFVNFALLSHMAVQLRDKVPRDTHVKGGIPYPRAFTGKDIVVNTCYEPLTYIRMLMFS
jgi:RHO1 GDP-GTP exchange protein 1/2